MLRLRPIQQGDMWMLYVWRHDPDTVRWSFRLPPTLEEHLKWCTEAERNPGVWIAENGPIDGIAEPVALIQLDSEHEVSINVNPLRRGQGFGPKCIRLLQHQHRTLRACVKPDNTRAIKMFTKCGFILVDAHITDTGQSFLEMGWEAEP